MKIYGTDIRLNSNYINFTKKRDLKQYPFTKIRPVAINQRSDSFKTAKPINAHIQQTIKRLINGELSASDINPNLQLGRLD